LVKGLKRNREHFQNLIVQKLLVNGQMSWKQLWETINWRGNKRFFHECLKSLENDGKIVKQKYSHKRVFYMLSQDVELLKQLALSLDEAEKLFPEALKEIAESRNLGYADAVAFYKRLIYRNLANFLNALETCVCTEEKWKDLARGLLYRFVDQFALMLAYCGHANPEAMEQTMSSIKESLRVRA